MSPILITLVAALALGPWGPPDAAGGRVDATPADAAETAVAEVNSVLSEARAAAQLYGRSNLGHYRKLNHRRLTAQGFTPRDDVRLTVYVSHTAYCFTATHTELPAGHQWRTASLDSRTQRAIPGDACATQAAAGGDAWVCRLPGVGA